MAEFRLITEHARSAGDVTSIGWRAVWCDTTLHWELRRLLSTVGLCQSSKDTAPHVHIRRYMSGLWKKACDDADVHMSQHICNSAKAHRGKGSTQSSEQLAWASSFGVLLILLSWSQGLKAVQGRLNSMQALQLLLATTTQSCCSRAETMASD